MNGRVLLKRPVFITRNKATASNPSCTGNCCCWHGQRGAVRAPGREFRVILGGAGSGQSNGLRSYTSTGPSLTQWANALGSGKPVSPEGLFGCGGSALLCVQRMVSTWSHHHSRRGTLRGRDDLECWGWTSACSPHLTACSGQLPSSTPSWEHHGAGMCKSFVLLHTASSNAGPFKQAPW